MIIQTIVVNACTPQTIVIGRRATYDTLQVVFDLAYLAEAYGSGAAVLAVKRSQDETAYPATITQDGNTLTWTISEADTYYVGAGECELMWYVNNGLAKTIIYPVVVMRDILQTAEEPPDAYENWVESLTALGAETLQNAQDAAQSASDAESAKGDAIAAKEAAEEAAEKAEEASVHSPVIQGGYWYIWNNGQYVNTGVQAEGQKGDKGDPGEKGDTGNGIASIVKTGTSGLVDTYTVTYTDGTTTTFTVTNGAKGDKGDTGATGNGIQSITKTGTSGNVDTYTITYTNGQTTTFTVTNGAVSSVAGKTGAVTLDANDVAFSDSGTYDEGTVGAAVSDAKNAISQKAPLIINTASGDVASFADGADGMQIKKLVGTIVPQQSGTGDPSPDNVRPISGWTGANVYCYGVNLFNKLDLESDTNHYLSDSGSFRVPGSGEFRVSNYIPVKAGFIYTLSNMQASTTSAVSMCWYTADKTYIKSEKYLSSITSKTVTAPNNAYYARLSIEYSLLNVCQFEFGSVATQYKPFAGNTLPINWQTEAGTIYGGTVTLNEDGSADVVADRGYKSFNSSDGWSAASGAFFHDGVFTTAFNTSSTNLDNGFRCNRYKQADRITNSSEIASMPDWTFFNQYTSSSNRRDRMWIKDSSIADLTALDTVFAANPLQVMYPLDTPQTYHIPDVGSLFTYLGTNNVWIDTGAITECDYPADTKLFLTARDEEITQSIAPIENGATASKEYAQGEYFFHNTKFCKALTAIASGATFTLNTNYTETTVAAELLAAQN